MQNYARLGITTVAIFLVTTLCGCGEEDSTNLMDGVDAERTVGTSDAQLLIDAQVINLDEIDTGIAVPTCEEGNRRICPDGCGTEVCENGEWSRRCEASVERCNGHDDNCNAQIDETFTAEGLGATCSTMLENGCEAMGIAVCTADQSNIECRAEPVVPESEICDGNDNDCDGVIDEGFNDQVCCAESFQCPLGHICESNRCVDPNAMGSNPDAATPCSSNAECTSLEECVDGLCRDLCFADDDCDPGFECSCPSGESCAFEVCMPEDPNGNSGCVDNFDCPSGQSCDLEQGVCVNNSEEPLCRTNSDCPAGYICNAQGLCERGSTGGPICLSSQDCPIGYFCDNAGQCISLYANADFCQDVTELNGTGSRSSTLSIGGSNLVVPSCGYHYIDGVLPGEVSDKMFKWVAPFTGDFVVDTVGSSFDTVIATYDQCGLNARETACNDDFNYPTSTDSRLSFSLIANEVVYLGVSGMDPFASGSFRLNYYATCSSDMDCPEAEMCTEGRCSGGMSGPQRCMADRDCASGQTCVNGTCRDRIPPQRCRSDQECRPGERCSNQVCVPGNTAIDFCQGVLNVPPSGRFRAVTQLGWQAVEPPCAPPTGNPGKDLVFRWRPAVSNSYTIRVDGPHPNAVLSVYNNCTVNRQLLNCDDDSGAGLNPSLTMFGAASTDYYVVVSSASNQFDGEFELVIEPIMSMEDERECTFSNNRECDNDGVCLDDECVDATDTNLCSRSESLIGGSRRNGRCQYPQMVEGDLDQELINDCVEDGYEGFDAHWRWQPCRPGRYRLTASAGVPNMDVSLALYTECNTSRTHEIECMNDSTTADESIEVDVGPNYFLANDPYGLFREIVISGRDANSSGDVILTIECLEGDCLN